ncbi:hypothetical protein EVAR_31443_1 [Eumeta japonica]|uniref:PiggyBac transposable element-derived protein domain-containing protein n=1 Tax=Eumeta variegata TaxID=151549 RepID=A0A4C1UZ75_EUMVA|nr:hypothetical protein EVAR_31443_1 [Eumeta japonica]
MILLDIFDDDIMKEIVIETNRYAHQVIDKAKAVDICQFNTLEEYWRKDTDIELLCFRNIMSYDRYILLTKCLHFSDNDKQTLPNAKSSKQPLAASYQSLTNSKQLPTDNREVRRKKNNNGKSVNDYDERAEAESSRVRTLARYLKCPGFYCMGTVRLTRKNIPEDLKKMKKNCEKGTIIARHSGDIIMVLA